MIDNMSILHKVEKARNWNTWESYEIERVLHNNSNLINEQLELIPWPILDLV